MNWWYNLFCTFSHVEGDLSPKHKWKLKQMCERQGRHMTNHRPLQGSLFRKLPNAARYYVLCFAKQLAAITPSCKMTKRWLIRNLSICGLNQQSMALQVSWHQNLWNENLAQNTFLHTSICFFQCWHMLRAKKRDLKVRASWLLQPLAAILYELWMRGVQKPPGGEEGGTPNTLHWVNKQKGGERECVRCSLHLYPPVSPINYNPIVSTRFSLQKF